MHTELKFMKEREKKNKSFITNTIKKKIKFSDLCQVIFCDHRLESINKLFPL